MTILHELNRSRSLETLRSDLLHVLTNITEGVHFASTALLEDKEAEKAILAALCPEKANKATDVAIGHLSKLFVQCNKWLAVLDKRGPETFWKVVASTTSQMESITLSPLQAKLVAFSFLRARQLWILRQINPASASTNVKTHLIAGIQRLLQRFEEQDEKPDALNWQKEQEWKLTEKEIRDANSRLMGPGRQMARGRIGLSFQSPHNLYPIGQLSSAPILERNPLGMLDSCIEKITPAEAVQALLSHSTHEVILTERLATKEVVQQEAATRSTTPGKAAREADKQSRSSKSPSSLLGRVIPTALKTKFKPNWMKGHSSRKDAGQSIAERPKRAQTADTASKVNSSSTKRRFMSEDATAPAKKQIVAKGKARSVSNPVISQPLLAPGKSAQAARSTSLHVPKTSKK